MTEPVLKTPPALDYQPVPARINWQRLLLAYVGLIAASNALTATQSSFTLTAFVGLKDLKFPNSLTALVSSKAGGILFFLFFPFLSYISDRNRTRFGRRIPYLAVAIIPCVLLFAITGWTPVIGRAHFPAAATMSILAFIFIVYQLFNLILDNALMWLVNDAIPQHQLARFFALIRIAGLLVGVVSTGAFLASSKMTSFDHRPLVHGIGAFLLLVTFALVILFVREKPLGPPRDTLPGAPFLRRFGHAIANFVVESFTHPIYLAYFAFSFFIALSWAGGVFHTIHLRDNLGVTLQNLGDMAVISLAATIILLFPAAWLADRIHPMRGLLIALILQIPFTLVSFFVNSYLDVLLVMGVSLPMVMLRSATMDVVAYRLFPRGQFAQFRFVARCFTGLGVTIGTLAIGWMMNWMRTPTPIAPMRGHYPAPQYRYVYLWELLFQLIALACFVITYLYWKKYGATNFQYEVERQPTHQNAFPVIQSTPAG